MAHHTNYHVMRSWAHDVVTQGRTRKMTGGSVRVDEEGVIHYFLQPRFRRDPVVLGTYIAKHKAIVLNGDGFTLASATGNQTRLRNLVRQEILEHESDFRLAIIPYAALTAAGVIVDSILPIFVRQDEQEIIFERFEPPSEDDLHFVENGHERVAELTHRGIHIRVSERAVVGYRNPEDHSQFTKSSRTPEQMTWVWAIVEWERRDQPYRIRVEGEWQTPLHFDSVGIATLTRTRSDWNQRIVRGGWGLFQAGDLPEEPGWYWQRTVHHLGACLFSARSEDGKRHKFLSAFDEDELSQMYFLAQLPDRCGATTYDEALHALAPPFVHRARQEGRQVLRQGDVFAVETNLTDEEVYARAKTRVRREVALYNSTPARLARVIAGELSEPEILPDETTDVGPCPCCQTGKRRIGWGPRSRHALSIYGTGHTATEVVVAARGVTYIKGVMHHDPALTEPGRQREHDDVVLTEGKWFLALRNQVPRKKTKPVVTSDDGENTEVATTVTA